MKPIVHMLAFAALLSAAPLAAAAADVIPADQAVRFVGKDGMVCGKVEKTRYAENAEGTPTFLYMGGAFPRHTFSARIPGDQRDKFKPSPEELEGRDVCIIGTITRDNSRAEIAVTSPANIKLATIK
jgi:hypothetical protein